MNVTVEISEEELDGDYGTVSGLRLTCERCSHSVEVFGTTTPLLSEGRSCFGTNVQMVKAIITMCQAGSESASGRATTATGSDHRRNDGREITTIRSDWIEEWQR